MAMEAQRKLLDALMGKDRNGDDNTTKHFTDDDVCKNHLCGLCPNDLFRNTKMDSGECPQKHSDVLRQDYEAAQRRGESFPYEKELMNSLQNIVSDCDRKIERAKQRIQHTPNDAEANEMASAVQALYAKAQELGEEGKIQESEDMLLQAEKLKAQQDPADDQGPSTQGQSQQEKLRVCEICSAFLSIYDSNRRLADHFGGKLHIGYLQIRERLKELKEKYPPGGGSGSSRSSHSGSHRGYSDRDRDRSRDRDSRHDRSRGRDGPYDRRDSGRDEYRGRGQDNYDRYRPRDDRRGSRDYDRRSRDREYRRR